MRGNRSLNSQSIVDDAKFGHNRMSNVVQRRQTTYWSH